MSGVYWREIPAPRRCDCGHAHWYVCLDDEGIRISCVACGRGWWAEARPSFTGGQGPNVSGVEAVGEGGDVAAGVVLPAETARRRRGRPLVGERHLAYEVSQPWEKIGMSRSTWYRRRRGG